MVFLLVLTLLLGFYMAWNIGANDVANAMGTSVGSKALTLKRAVLIAAVLEFAGAFFAGSNVCETIQHGILAPQTFAADPMVYVYGMMGALLATGFLLQIGSYFGLPLSTTHAIVGGIVGFGVALGGVEAIYWGHLFWVGGSWIASPLISGLIAYAVFRSISLMRKVPLTSSFPLQTEMEKPFVYLQIGSACLMAFAHGANDIANAIGPVAAVFEVLKTQTLESHAPIPSWLLAIGGLGIVLGLATWGWRVIETVGEKITELTPTKGFSAEFGAACTILLASKLGFPVSTTHALVGAVLGVGLTGGIRAIHFSTLKSIAISWVVTIPLCAVLSIFSFYLLQSLFG
jgi:PiT family inorganic phosphate transporter